MGKLFSVKNTASGVSYVANPNAEITPGDKIAWDTTNHYADLAETVGDYTFFLGLAGDQQPISSNIDNGTIPQQLLAVYGLNWVFGQPEDTNAGTVDGLILKSGDTVQHGDRLVSDTGNQSVKKWTAEALNTIIGTVFMPHYSGTVLGDGTKRIPVCIIPTYAIKPNA